MCDTCGCGDPDVVPVEIQERILAGNERTARHNREHFAGHGVLAINLMGSPGSGKTALLEATARHPDHGLKLCAVSGDLATDRDADRLRAAGIPSKGITTGSACHLDAGMVHRAVHEMDLDGMDLLVIENVGNLVCPAIYDLGQAASVVALSVTEGVDKPLKYPVMFHRADLVLLTKCDLLPHLDDVDAGAVRESLARVMPAARLIETSARTGQGMDQWLGWLSARRAELPAVTSPPKAHTHS